MYLKTFELGPTYSLSAPGLAQEAALNKIKAKLSLLTDIDMLLMTEKGIRDRIYSYY